MAGDRNSHRLVKRSEVIVLDSHESSMHYRSKKKNKIKKNYHAVTLNTAKPP